MTPVHQAKQKEFDYYTNNRESTCLDLKMYKEKFKTPQLVDFASGKDFTPVLPD
jgi:hypothetical protein